MSILNNFTAYVKQAWANRPTLTSPLSAARLNHMEAGIKANSDAVEAISNAVISNIINDPNKIASMATAYALQQQITKLNSEKGKSIFASNLLADYEQPTFLRWGGNTLNSPYADKETNFAEGFAIAHGSSTSYMTIVAWQKGGASPRSWTRTFNNGVDSGWREHAYLDVSA